VGGSQRKQSGVAMYRLALIGSTLFGLVVTQAVAEDCITPSAGAATLRASPTANSQPRGSLSPGDTLPLVASVPHWYETRLQDGKVAFASKQSTDIVPCPQVQAVTANAPAFELHAIDVGTGLAIFVRGSDFSLLYDAGSNDDLARGDSNRVTAYLATLGPQLKRLDHIVLSHPHRDHVELLPDVIARYKPKVVWHSGAFNDICGYRYFLLTIAADPSIQYRTATQDGGTEQVELKAKNCYGVNQPRRTLALTHGKRVTTETVVLGQNASMTFLYVDGSRKSDFNKGSLVIRLDLGARRVLLMGDAEAGSRANPGVQPSANSIEGKLLACCNTGLRADILVVGHHGSKTSSRKSFLNAVGASLFLVSSGPTRYSGVTLPDPEVVTELEGRGQVFKTFLEDDACRVSPDKVGPDADGKAGGCDNVLVTFSSNGSISAGYRRVSD